MSGKSARTKGLAYERHVVKRLKPLFKNVCRALVGSIEDNVKKIDLRNTGALAIQCKRLKKYVSVNTIKEIQCSDNEIPVVWTKADREPEVVILYADDFIRMLEDIGVVYDVRK